MDPTETLTGLSTKLSSPKPYCDLLKKSPHQDWCGDQFWMSICSRKYRSVRFVKISFWVFYWIAVVLSAFYQSLKSQGYSKYQSCLYPKMYHIRENVFQCHAYIVYKPGLIISGLTERVLFYGSEIEFCWSLMLVDKKVSLSTFTSNTLNRSSLIYKIISIRVVGICTAENIESTHSTKYFLDFLFW